MRAFLHMFGSAPTSTWRSRTRKTGKQLATSWISWRHRKAMGQADCSRVLAPSDPHPIPIRLSSRTVLNQVS